MSDSNHKWMIEIEGTGPPRLVLRAAEDGATIAEMVGWYDSSKKDQGLENMVKYVDMVSVKDRFTPRALGKHKRELVQSYRSKVIGLASCLVADLKEGDPLEKALSELEVVSMLITKAITHGEVEGG